MKRYKSIPTTKSPSGKSIYTTSRYPRVPKSFSDIYVYTNIKDRYDTLAQQYYGDSTLWWIISIANEDRIPLNISQIISNFEELNKGNTLQPNNNNTNSKTY